MSRSETGQAGDLTDVVITPAMIEAGVYEAKEHALGAPLQDLVRSVFIAMLTEQRASQLQQ